MRQHQAHRPPLGIAICVTVGGACGSVIRWGLAEIMEPVSGLMLVNIVGCVFIGLLYGSLEGRQASPWWIQPLVGTGFLGGFTTFSSTILATTTPGDPIRWEAVLGWIVALPLACVAGAWVGHRATRQQPIPFGSIR